MSFLVSLNWLYKVAPSTIRGSVSGRMHSMANSQHAAWRSGNSNILAALIIPEIIINVFSRSSIACVVCINIPSVYIHFGGLKFSKSYDNVYVLIPQMHIQYCISLNNRNLFFPHKKSIQWICIVSTKIIEASDCLRGYPSKHQTGLCTC